MIEKRFKLIYINEQHISANLYDDGIFIGSIENGEELIANLLNELHEEKNYFERKKCEYWNKFNLAHLDNINLRKENEQLKQRLKDKDQLLQKTLTTNDNLQKRIIELEND